MIENSFQMADDIVEQMREAPNKNVLKLRQLIDNGSFAGGIACGKLDLNDTSLALATYLDIKGVIAP